MKKRSLLISFCYGLLCEFLVSTFFFFNQNRFDCLLHFHFSLFVSFNWILIWWSIGNLTMMWNFQSLSCFELKKQKMKFWIWWTVLSYLMNYDEIDMCSRRVVSLAIFCSSIHFRSRSISTHRARKASVLGSLSTTPKLSYLFERLFCLIKMSSRTNMGLNDK